MAAATLLAVVTAACEKSVIDTSDSSAPTVEIQLMKGNAFEPTTEANLGSERLEIMALVDDPQGVRSIGLQILGRTSNGCNIDGATWSGSFPLELPEDQFLELEGDEEGKVATRFPLLMNVDRPECSKLGAPNEKGIPYGHEITLRATGKNWGSDSGSNTATTDLVLKVQ